MEKRSKLSIIKEMLMRNKDATIVVEWGSPFNENKWSNPYYFYVVPKKPLYTAIGLQKFMLSLVSNPKPDHKTDFFEDGKKLIFGELLFEEQIGARIESQCIMTLFHDFIFDREKLHRDFANVYKRGTEVVKKAKTHPIMRLITVIVFPTVKIAEKKNIGFYEREISKQHLAREIAGSMPDNPYASIEFNEKLQTGYSSCPYEGMIFTRDGRRHHCESE